eukprot:gnl/Spiro4/2151_TR1029_c0_g1_i1.p1 gnl/Spiro4/2151_TR1029_c0_g1~~gnl/Spiro4/2151_TR1029_c0_g1_i1.p1  ORF type:complete len:135 (+),score=25.35 gnl/Spiro4/2151_TR1029_c0_g1_i1:62-406(+)
MSSPANPSSQPPAPAAPASNSSCPWTRTKKFFQEFDWTRYLQAAAVGAIVSVVMEAGEDNGPTSNLAMRTLISSASLALTVGKLSKQSERDLAVWAGVSGSLALAYYLYTKYGK